MSNEITDVEKINSELKTKVSVVLKKLNKLTIECVKVSGKNGGEGDKEFLQSSMKTPIPIIFEKTEDIEGNNGSSSSKFSEKKRRVRNRKKSLHESVNSVDDQSTASTPKEIEKSRNRRKSRHESGNSVNDDQSTASNSKENEIDDDNGVVLEKTSKYDACDYPLVLTKETLLVFKLLNMSPQERDDFLIKQAKERQIVVFDKKSNMFRLNKRLKNVNVDGKLSEIKRQRNRKESKNDVDKFSDLTFEGLVNQFLYGNQPKPNEDILLENKNASMDNKSFDSDVNQQNLLEFVDKLVDRKIGYIVEGEVRISAINNQDAYITYSTDERDIYIKTNILRQCALHGDRVKIFVKKTPIEMVEAIPTPSPSGADDTIVELDSTLDDDDEEDNGLGLLETNQQVNELLSGFVITIVKKNHPRKCVGILRKRNPKKKWILFQPRDKRLFNIKIRQDTLPKFVTTTDEQIEVLYYAKIIDTTHDDFIGEIIEKIGASGELEFENQAVILQNNLQPPSFPDEILSSIPTLPYAIPDVEYTYREDLRADCVFTIDPITARDLDDALSLRKIDDTTIEIGVHISDVTHYIPEGSQLDDIIKHHTTSIYLVNKVYHMLPEQLCMLCSLLPGEDKLAFSVFFNFDKKTGAILKTRFAKTIINSCSQLAYEHAQLVIDNPDTDQYDSSKFPKIYNGYTVNKVADVIKDLNHIALILRKKRMDNGALRIDQPKIKFNLDPETGMPISYNQDNQQESNYMIEDFMLLANQSVAAEIFKTYPDMAILRNHSEPKPHLIEMVTRKVEGFGMTFDASTPKNIRESIEKLVSNSSDPITTAAVLNVFAAKIMTRARYFCSTKSITKQELRHYALSIPIYTHFTSPIRRYPDVLVHRLLAAAINLTPQPNRTPEEFQEIAKVCNEQKFDAKNASTDSTNLYFIHYIKSLERIEMKAAVLNVMEYMMEVILIDTGHLIKIRYYSMEPQILVEYRQHDKLPEITINPKGIPYLKTFTLRVFSLCLVEVYVEKGQIKGRLIPTLMEGTGFNFKGKMGRPSKNVKQLTRRDRRDVIDDKLDDED